MVKCILHSPHYQYVYAQLIVHHMHVNNNESASDLVELASPQVCEWIKVMYILELQGQQ